MASACRQRGGRICTSASFGRTRPRCRTSRERGWDSASFAIPSRHWVDVRGRSSCPKEARCSPSPCRAAAKRMTRPWKPSTLPPRRARSVDIVARAVLIGIGATIVMDLWAVLRKRVFGIASLDYRMLGRWIGNLPRGQFVHDKIGAASPVRGELIIGWCAHYAIGITFALLLLVLWGPGWARHPTPLPAM